MGVWEGAREAAMAGKEAGLSEGAMVAEVTEGAAWLVAKGGVPAVGW